jgi:hypothetical protein
MTTDPDRWRLTGHDWWTIRARDPATADSIGAWAETITGSRYIFELELLTEGRLRIYVAAGRPTTTGQIEVWESSDNPCGHYADCGIMLRAHYTDRPPPPAVLDAIRSKHTRTPRHRLVSGPGHGQDMEVP